MRVLIQDFAEDEGRFLAELQDAFPDVEFAAAESEEDQKTAIKDADVFYGFLTPEVYAAADTLKWIQVAGAGIDGLIKLPGLVDNEIVVTNTKGPHVDAMADHVIGMMINMAHRWMDHFDDQRAHRWEGRKYLDMQIEITGSTMGIFGLGDVGKAVARRAQGFGIDVYAVDKFPKPNEEVRETWGLERLDDLLERSDWFVAAAPSTVETRGAIDARRLGLLKEGGHVIVYFARRHRRRDRVARWTAVGACRGRGARRLRRGAPARGRPSVGHAKRSDNASLLGRHDIGHPERRAGLQGESAALSGRRAFPVRLRQEGGVLGAVLSGAS